MRAKPIHARIALICIGLASFFSIILLSGCERVKEYRCSAEQIETLKAQLDLCDRIADGNLIRRRNCYDAAQAAHCEVAREFQRVGYEAQDNQP